MFHCHLENTAISFGFRETPKAPSGQDLISDLSDLSDQRHKKPSKNPTPRGEGNVSVVPISEATLSSAVRTGARKTSTPLSPKPRASGLDNSTFSTNGRMEIIKVQKIVWKMLVKCWSNILEIVTNVQSEVRTTPEPSKSKQSLRQPQASTKENDSKLTTDLQNQFRPVAIPSSQILCIQGNNPTWHFNPSALDTFSLSRKTSTSSIPPAPSGLALNAPSPLDFNHCHLYLESDMKRSRIMNI